MNSQQLQLKDYLFYGLMKEIFFADESRAVAAEIGKHAASVNEKGYGRLFASLQAVYSDRQTLAVAKLFDKAGARKKDGSRYPTRNISTILEVIESNASGWTLPGGDSLWGKLMEEGQSRETVTAYNNAELSMAIVTHYHDAMPSHKKTDPLSLSLMKIRESRDKVIAHNESIQDGDRNKPTWGDAQVLVEFAKEFVITIGYGFLGITHSNSGRYRNFGDTPDILAIQMEMLLERAKLREGDSIDVQL